MLKGSLVLGLEDTGSRMSRLGKGDFGQNRRNILELWAALRAAGVSG